MNNAPLPAPLPLPDAGGARAIDDRIRAVEQRLIARERSLVARFADLGQRLRHAARPRRVLSPALGIGLAALVLWGWLRGRSRAPVAAAREGHAAPPRADLAGVPWANWLALAWPLLPTAWRARVSPATAATLVSLGMPLAQRLFAPSSHPPPATMAQVDLTRYAGIWYEIARLPTPFEAACDGQPTVHYTRRGDGLHIHYQCLHKGSQRSAMGVARVVPGSGNAKLKVSFWPTWLRWLPLAWADYWVLYVDDAYRVAMVAHPQRHHLWLLSRRARIDDAQLGDLVRVAAERGFAVDRLRVRP
jgi:apolipoprotein D and lipocalin family protein